MVPWLSAATPRAPNRASVIAWLVSTLPAATAAGYFGASIESSGMTMRIGFRHPSLSGMSSSTRQRKT